MADQSVSALGSPSSQPSNQLSSYVEESHGIIIEVKPFFLPERSLPAEKIFFYAYRIQITNTRKLPVQLMRRSWVVKNGDGVEERIEGDGVVGKQPIIKPQDAFQYASFCPLDTLFGNMRGRYRFHCQKSGPFMVRIPLFFLRPPQTLR